MRKNQLFLALIFLILASLACSLFGGGDSSTDVIPSNGGDAPAPASSGEHDTKFPMPSKVENFIDLGDESINYQTPMKLEDVVSFYRGEFVNAGYDERDITTVVNDTTFSIVWDGHPTGKAIVVQGVDLGNGNVNVNVRFEDV